MQNISKLTSKKLKIKYCVIYSIYSLLYLASPLLVMEFINSVVAKNYQMMILFASLYFCSFIVIQLFSYLFAIYVGKVEGDNFINFFSKLNKKLENYDLSRATVTLNDLNQNIGQNYELANPYFFIQPVELIFSIINIVVIYIIMFCINWQITLILLFIIPLSFLVSKLFEKRMYKRAKDNLENIKNVKSYTVDQLKLTKEERFLSKKQLTCLDLFLGKYKKTQSDNNRTKSVYLYFFVYCFLNLAILIVILLSGFLNYEGLVAIGVLYAFQNYTSQLWIPGECLMSYSASYLQAKPALNDLDSLLSLPEASYSNEKINSIKLNDFYPLDKRGNPLCESINYEFKLGNKYLICGSNGCGKTSLIEAIMGFHKRYCGEILINDKCLLSDDIVYISAEAYLSSFYNNESKKLSSGQKKFSQINLFLETDKNVYIFDEPTNFIDDIKRLEIIKLINSLESKNKLIIVVSHDDTFNNGEFNILKIIAKDN